MPDDVKRAKADYVVETHKGLDDTRVQLRGIVDKLLPPKPASPKFCL